MLELTSFKSSLFFYQSPRLDVSILLELMASFERELDEMGQKALSVPGNQAGDRCRVVVWNLQGPKCSRWQEFWDPVWIRSPRGAEHWTSGRYCHKTVTGFLGYCLFSIFFPI